MGAGIIVLIVILALVGLVTLVKSVTVIHQAEKGLVVNRSQPVECPIWVKQDAGRMLSGGWSLKTEWINSWSGSTAWPLVKSFNSVKLIRCVRCLADSMNNACSEESKLINPG